jgi:ribosomal protein S18
MKKLQTKYAQRTEPDYILFEILQALITARSKIRSKDVKRYEEKLQAIIDELYAELKGI